MVRLVIDNISGIHYSSATDAPCLNQLANSGDSLENIPYMLCMTL